MLRQTRSLQHHRMSRDLQNSRKIQISNSVLEGGENVLEEDLPERICFTDREKNLYIHTHKWMASATAIRLPVTISKGPGIFSFHALYIPWRIVFKKFVFNMMHCNAGKLFKKVFIHTELECFVSLQLWSSKSPSTLCRKRLSVDQSRFVTNFMCP